MKTRNSTAAATGTHKKNVSGLMYDGSNKQLIYLQTLPITNGFSVTHINSAPFGRRVWKSLIIELGATLSLLNFV